MPTYIHNGKEYWYSDEGLEDVKAWAGLLDEATLVDILCQPLKVGSFSQDIIECEIYKKELVEDSDANL